MNSNNLSPNPNLFSRQDFLRILEAGTAVANYRFARQAALTWLALFPGDMAVNLFLAKSMIGEGKYPAAVATLEKLVNQDPELLETNQALAGAYHLAGSERYQQAQACVEVLKGGTGRGDKMPGWAAQLSQVRRLARRGDLSGAEKLVHQVVSQEPDLRLAAVMHLHIDKQFQDEATVYQLASLYHERWPDCLQFALYLAELKMARGEENEAVNLLHQCVSNDLTGQVAERLWGKDHRYQPLWPDGMKIDLQMGVPAEVAIRLGWNRLPQGELVAPPSNMRVAKPVAVNAEVAEDATAKADPTSVADDGSLEKVQKSLDKLGKKVKNPSLARADGRFPMYVVFSSRKGLETKYGPASRGVVVDHMRRLADEVGRKPGWGACVFLPDDAEIAASYGLKAVEEVDPWKLKLTLADFDQALAKKGQMIGALLIVGGADVVPFHNLPNPTDDDDSEVPSDNPYATLDANFFVPEWPVGRLPGEAGSDAGLLLEALRASIKYHSNSKKNLPQLGSILRALLAFLRSRTSAANGKNFGYTAEVWQRSSEEVFREAGNGGKLYQSPPEYYGSIPNEQVLTSPLSYFNLHGMADSPEWYGQRDFNNIKPGPDYPVALTPKNLVKNGHAPQVVYSEACYGGHILEKSEDLALALKFLSVGVMGMVGSTTISYGSAAAPLIGADLLGYHFWRNLRDGLTTGEALMQAKVALVKEMNQRQGFLDGEDQKTLISFVLYGDPLVTFSAVKAKGRWVMRAKSLTNIKTICDRRNGDLAGVNVTAEMLYEAKKAVEPYLPGLDQAEMTISKQHVTCDSKAHICPTNKLGVKLSHPEKVDGIVMTFCQKVAVDQLTHRHYARVTVNGRGKVVKLALSR